MQKSSLISLQKNSTQLSGLVGEKAYLIMENALIRLDERFALIDLYFRPCQDDKQYHVLIGEFIENLLLKTDDLLKKCNKLSYEEEEFPNKAQLKENIRRTEVFMN